MTTGRMHSICFAVEIKVIEEALTEPSQNRNQSSIDFFSSPYVSADKSHRQSCHQEKQRMTNQENTLDFAVNICSIDINIPTFKAS